MWHLIAADLGANVDRKRRQGLAYWARVLGKLLVTPQVQVVVLFRIGSALRGTPLAPLRYVLRSIGLTLSGAEIHPDATLGPGLALVHSSGVVIGPGVTAGRDCRIAQGVTLGEAGRGSRRDGFPVLGDHVTLGVGAVVLGPYAVGDWAVIGARSVVTRDVPARAVAVGAPARVIRQMSPAEAEAL